MATLIRVAYRMVTAFVVPINAATIPDTPAATPITTPIGASTRTIFVPSGLWPDAALVLGTAPIHAAVADSTASNAASAAPVHRAALHQGQRHSRAVLRAACA